MRARRRSLCVVVPALASFLGAGGRSSPSEAAAPSGLESAGSSVPGAVPLELSAPEDPPDRGALYVVGLPGPTQPEWIESLEREGVAVLQYYPPYAYLVFGTAWELEAARRLPHVVSIAPWAPARKLAPGVLELCVEAPRRGDGRRTVEVVVQLFQVGEANRFRGFLARAGAEVRSEARFSNRIHIRAQVPISLLAPIARWPPVYRVELFPRFRLRGEREAMVVAEAAWAPGDCVRPGYGAWLARKGASGEGAVVQVMDDGVEQGDASGTPGTAHPDLLGRLAGFDNATSDPSAAGRAGHGSLNAGLIAGTAATGTRDSEGFLRGQGIAPRALVFATKIFNDAGIFDVFDRSFADLVAPAVAAGCAISSNSWGADLFGEYDAAAAEFDALARDAHEAPGLQPLAFVFAAGNEGELLPGGAMTVGSPATAKNVISVGASESCDADGLDGCGVPPAGADALRDVVAFSSRGPLRDGRLAPTLVAPGTHVAGIASTAEGYDGSGVCDPYWPPGQTSYARGSGTSHSCPIVAGAAALFYEAHARGAGTPPSPALLKAAMVAATRDIAGGEDGFGGTIPPAPNPVEGWGLLSLEGLLSDPGALPEAARRDVEAVLAKTGDAWETRAFPLSSEGQVKVVLAWTDPPGLPGAEAALVNDLDLEVESEGTLFLGNVFEGGISVPGGERDRRNNVEAVAIERPGPVLTVRVVASNIAGDAIPDRPGFEQDFAVVVQGAVENGYLGSVRFERAWYACGSEAGVRLFDLHLASAGSARVSVTSSAAATPFALDLAEVPAGSGRFEGKVPLGDGPGRLRVADGGTIVATYLDSDDGSGRPAESTSAAAIDCVPPRIAGVRVEDVTLSSATISWTTDEETRGSVRSGRACPPSEETPARFYSTEHRVRIAGLDPGSACFFAVSAEDRAGNASEADREGRCYFFHTSSESCTFEDDFEPAPLPGWSHESRLGRDAWTVRALAGAHSPTRAWHSSGSGSAADSWLTTPPLEIFAGQELSFWHRYEFEEGYDGAVIEISSDGGATWEDLGPHIAQGRYSGFLFGNPLGERPAWTGVSGPAMERVVADLSAFAGAGRLVRFRVGCDDSTVEGAGWYIDDVAACGPVNKRAAIALDRPSYRCEDAAIVRLADLDLRGRGSAEATASLDGSPLLLPVRLVEAAPGSGFFEGQLRLGKGEGALPVEHGKAVSVRYADEDSGLDAGPLVAAASSVADCRAPGISGVRFLEIFDDRAKVAWETDEPSTGEAFAGEVCGAAAARGETALGGVSHVVALEGLERGKAYRLAVTARDEAGNASTFDAGGACLPLAPSSLSERREGFDGEASGWTHWASAGSDGWTFAEDPAARTPPRAAFHPGSESANDSCLSTPPFFVPPGGYLAFWHTYEFDEGWDGAVLELSADGGATWLDLGGAFVAGGYDSILFAGPLAGRAAWSGGTFGPMGRVLVDLDRWAGSYVRVRFRIAAAGYGASGGWAIDDVEVGQAVRATARVSFGAPAYACGSGIPLRLLDAGLAGAGNAAVRVRSTSDPGGRDLVLAEVAPGSGVFEGVLRISEAPGGGTLTARHGDEIVAAYEDEADATGRPRETTASAWVDCVGPVISRVSAESPDGRSVTVSFETDEPAAGTFEFGGACGAFDVVETRPDPARSHRHSAGGLSQGSWYFFQVSATDLAGNRSLDDAGGACHRFRSPVPLPLFEDKLEPRAQAGWRADPPWEVATDAFAHSPTRSWRLVAAPEDRSACLVLPPFVPESPSFLEFWHAYAFGFGDVGGVLEASADGGATWVDLGGSILEGGYTGVLDSFGPPAGPTAWTGARPGSMTRVLARLDALSPGRPALVRFRFANSWSWERSVWSIDDVRVFRTVGRSGAVAFRRIALGCESQAGVCLADADLAGRKAAEVEVVGADGGSASVPLGEEAPGYFTGSFLVSDAPGAFRVVARDGDTVTARYRDETDENGAARTAEATAVVDCSAPEIRRVYAQRGDSGRLELGWDVSETALGSALQGSACASLAEVPAVPILGERFRAPLSFPGPGASIHVRVEARDLLGNRATAPGPAGCFSVEVVARPSFEDRFEPPDPGWTHSAARGEDDWRVATFASSHSPTRSYHAGNDGAAKDAALVSPPLDVSAEDWFSFWHTFELETGYDFARLEISTDGGRRWIDLGEDIVEGGYDATEIPGFDLPFGWTGGAVGKMRHVWVDVGRYAGSARLFRFRILCDDSEGSAGWYVDDVALARVELTGSGAAFFRGNCNADSRLNLTDAVFLLDHLFRGGPEPPCPRACDADGNDILNLTDAVYLLNHLFLGGREPPGPGSCGILFGETALECPAPACSGL